MSGTDKSIILKDIVHQFVQFTGS